MDIPFDSGVYAVTTHSIILYSFCQATFHSYFMEQFLIDCIIVLLYYSNVFLSYYLLPSL